ncbi:hypothetical protein BUE93_21085 [Chromobacterium amazonense]|uniref:Uncharacterized protein n=1 Tax=Chromobacterium amazonense TaxID=1382803 RepID=A0A2S9WYX6_9NEIS|nr:hypothetical protein BUE93_21085 [Chromobacterium amazonense]
MVVMEKLGQYSEWDEEFCRLHRVGRICKQLLRVAAPDQHLYLTRQELNEINMAIKSISSVSQGALFHKAPPPQLGKILIQGNRTFLS